MSTTEYRGPERRQDVGDLRRYVANLRLWTRILTVWIVIFTVVIFWSIRTQRHSIHQLQDDKANISSLERTNCGLRAFLKTAQVARLQEAKHATGAEKTSDLQAAKGYGQLLENFPEDHCDLFIHK